MSDERSPSAASAKTWFGHPLGLFVLFGVEMWERFSFYGMRAILGLYLKCAVDGMANPPPGAVEAFNPGRGWPKEEASNLMGWYGGMAYLLPILGGLIADKLIGTHRSMVVGGLLIAAGHIVLAISGMGEMAINPAGLDLFIFGLALIVVGTGHFKPSVSVMVSQLYPDGDPRREGAFGIFYMGINVGAFLGTTACAYLGEQVGWHYGFGAAAAGMLAGLAMYLTVRPKYLEGIGLPRDGKGASAPVFLLTGIGIAAVVAVFFHLGLLKRIDQTLSQPWLVWVLLLGGIAWAVFFTATQEANDRGPVAAIFIYMVFNTFFWLAFEQAATSINFFTDEKTDRMLGTFLVPTGWFQDINPFGIVLLAPIFGALWTMLERQAPQSQPAGQNRAGPDLVGIGLHLHGVGRTASQRRSQSRHVVDHRDLHAAHHRRDFLVADGTGLRHQDRSQRHVTLLMGIWFLSSFMAYVIGGKLAGMTDRIEKGEIKLPWSFGGQADFFFLFVATSFGAGALILILSPWLKKLTAGRE